MTYVCHIPKNGSFPYLQDMKLLIDMETKLAGEESVIALSIKGAIQRGRPVKEIITTCKEMIQDNEIVMWDILGKDILERIKRY